MCIIYLIIIIYVLACQIVIQVSKHIRYFICSAMRENFDIMLFSYIQITDFSKQKGCQNLRQNCVKSFSKLTILLN